MTMSVDSALEGSQFIQVKQQERPTGLDMESEIASVLKTCASGRYTPACDSIKDSVGKLNRKSQGFIQVKQQERPTGLDMESEIAGVFNACATWKYSSGCSSIIESVGQLNQQYQGFIQVNQQERPAGLDMESEVEAALKGCANWRYSTACSSIAESVGKLIQKR